MAVVPVVVARGDPPGVVSAPVPVHVGGAVPVSRIPEPAMGGMKIPETVAVGDRQPGVVGNPVQAAGGVGPTTTMVGTPGGFDAGAPGTTGVDRDPVATVVEVRGSRQWRIEHGAAATAVSALDVVGPEDDFLGPVGA